MHILKLFSTFWKNSYQGLTKFHSQSVKTFKKWQFALYPNKNFPSMPWLSVQISQSYLPIPSPWIAHFHCQGIWGNWLYYSNQYYKLQWFFFVGKFLTIQPLLMSYPSFWIFGHSIDLPFIQIFSWNLVKFRWTDSKVWFVLLWIW